MRNGQDSSSAVIAALSLTVEVTTYIRKLFTEYTHERDTDLSNAGSNQNHSRNAVQRISSASGPLPPPMSTLSHCPASIDYLLDHAVGKVHDQF